jgi:hypothetical protein
MFLLYGVVENCGVAAPISPFESKFSSFAMQNIVYVG